MPGDDTSSEIAAGNDVVHLDDVAEPAAHRGQLVERHPALLAVEVEAQDAATPFTPIIDVDDLHSVFRDERLGDLPDPLHHQTVHLEIKSGPEAHQSAA